MLWKGWSWILPHVYPEDCKFFILSCIQDGRLWKWCGLQYLWSLVDTCSSNPLLIGSVLECSSASLALGRCGNELVAAPCRAGDNNEDCSGRMGGTFCLPQLVWYMSCSTIMWPKGFLSVWRRGIEPFEISYVLSYLLLGMCVSVDLSAFLKFVYEEKIQTQNKKWRQKSQQITHAFTFWKIIWVHFLLAISERKS